MTRFEAVALVVLFVAIVIPRGVRFGLSQPERASPIRLGRCLHGCRPLFCP